MLVVGVLAPCWPQLREFMATRPISGSLDAAWWRDALCGWFFGQPWAPESPPANPLLGSMAVAFNSAPFIHGAGMAVLIAWLVAGLGTMARRRELRPLFAWSLGAPVLMLVHMAVTQTRPYDWYLAPFLPGLLMAASAPGAVIARSSARRPALCCGVVAAVAFAAATHRPRQLFRNHPTEPARESVAIYRAITNPRHPGIEQRVISGGFKMFTEGYDPCLHRFDSVDELEALRERADSTGRELFINVGFIEFLRASPETKDIVARLEDPGSFEHVRTLHGLLPFTTREVYRHRKRSSQRADVSRGGRVPVAEVSGFR
jgi:hypothetical protein